MLVKDSSDDFDAADNDDDDDEGQCVLSTEARGANEQLSVHMGGISVVFQSSRTDKDDEEEVDSISHCEVRIDGNDEVSQSKCGVTLLQPYATFVPQCHLQ